MTKKEHDHTICQNRLTNNLLPDYDKILILVLLDCRERKCYNVGYLEKKEKSWIP